ncbi:LolA-related protein [Viridibacterium curvum]|uniref:Outer membrane lipoprotein carrier protein LolA n=1 Tax=Viridibacterium curvum TaxID=1101404 RepID=A0ABP9R1J3_9RHOO
MSRRRLKSLLLPLLFPLLLLATSAQASDLKLAELMGLLAQTRSARATFVEQKFIAVLDKPVESSGELAFTAPDVLEKRTLQPKQEAITLRGNEITLERGKRSMIVSLQDYPDAAVFVESIRATLAGDQKALESVWRVEADGTLARWTLRLTPINANAYVSRIRMQGTRNDVKQIEIEQKDGDRSVMTITRLPQP